MAFHPLRRALIITTCLVASGWLVACGGGSSSANPTPTTPPAPSAEKAAADAAVADGLVSAVYGTVRGGSTNLGTAGLLVKGGSAKVQGSEYFQIGSNTKAMTALVAAQLVKDGQLRWDTRLLDLIPEAAAKALPAYQNVTLEQLLNHRSGLPGFQAGEDFLPFAEYVQDTQADYSTATKSRTLFTQWVLTQAPVPPTEGLTWHYSNAGYVLAGAMIERAAGQPFEAVFERVIVTQLGVQGRWALPHLGEAGHPRGHIGNSGTSLTVIPLPLDAQSTVLEAFTAPAGDFSVTPQGFAHWLGLHLQALQGQATALPADYMNRIKGLQMNEYALGWMGGNANGHAVIWHNGADLGFEAIAALDPAGHHAVFGLTNSFGFDAQLNDWVSPRLASGLLAVDQAAR